MKMRWLCVFLGLCLAPLAHSADETMDLEIDHLLFAVGESECTFIRNGKEYAAADARDHLARKRRRGKRYYESADEFIENIASKSSWSGKPYQIRCDDEPAVPAGEWFGRALAVFRDGTQAKSDPVREEAVLD
jgi:hypothetical protein